MTDNDSEEPDRGREVTATILHRSPYAAGAAPSSASLAVVVNEGMPIQKPEPETPLVQVGRRMASFADPDIINLTFERLGWSIQNEMELYAEIAENATVAPKVRIAAAMALNKLAYKAMILRGDISPVSATRSTRHVDEDGTVITETQEMAKMVLQTQSNLNRALPLQEPNSDGQEGDSEDEEPADAVGIFHEIPTGSGPRPDDDPRDERSAAGADRSTSDSSGIPGPREQYNEPSGPGDAEGDGLRDRDGSSAATPSITGDSDVGDRGPDPLLRPGDSPLTSAPDPGDPAGADT